MVEKKHFLQTKTNFSQTKKIQENNSALLRERKIR